MRMHSIAKFMVMQAEMDQLIPVSFLVSRKAKPTPTGWKEYGSNGRRRNPADVHFASSLPAKLGDEATKMYNNACGGSAELVWGTARCSRCAERDAYAVDRMVVPTITKEAPGLHCHTCM